MDIPDKIVIDFDQLTLGDIEDGEKIAGVGFAEALAGGQPSVAVTVALLYVFLRKTMPDITIEDVRGLGLPVLDRLTLEVADSENPTPAGDASS